MSTHVFPMSTCCTQLVYHYQVPLHAGLVQYFTNEEVALLQPFSQ